MARRRGAPPSWPHTGKDVAVVWQPGRERRTVVERELGPSLAQPKTLLKCLIIFPRRLRRKPKHTENRCAASVATVKARQTSRETSKSTRRGWLDTRVPVSAKPASSPRTDCFFVSREIIASIVIMYRSVILLTGLFHHAEKKMEHALRQVEIFLLPQRKLART